MDSVRMPGGFGRSGLATDEAAQRDAEGAVWTAMRKGGPATGEVVAGPPSMREMVSYR